MIKTLMRYYLCVASRVTNQLSENKSSFKSIASDIILIQILIKDVIKILNYSVIISSKTLQV